MFLLCLGLSEGHDLMHDAAGMVGVLFMRQLKEGTHRLLNFCFRRMRMSMRKTSECCHVLLVAVSTMRMAMIMSSVLHIICITVAFVLKWRCFVVCLDGGLIDVSFVFGIE